MNVIFEIMVIPQYFGLDKVLSKDSIKAQTDCGVPFCAGKKSDLLDFIFSLKL